MSQKQNKTKQASAKSVVLATLAEVLVQFLVFTWQLETLGPVSAEPEILFWPLKALHTSGTQIYRENTHIHK